MSRNRHTRWCFTMNNYTEQNVSDLKSKYQQGDFTYLIFGIEMAPTTNTPHLQGYLQLSKRERLSGVKKFMPTAHLEAAIGTPEQCADYCKKDNCFTELGIHSYTVLTFKEHSLLRNPLKNSRICSTMAKTYTTATRTTSRSQSTASTGLKTTRPGYRRKNANRLKYSVLSDLQELAKHAPLLTTPNSTTMDQYSYTASQPTSSLTDIMDNPSCSSMTFAADCLSPLCYNYWIDTETSKWR